MIILIDPSLRDNQGHHCAYAKRIYDACVDQKIPFKLLAHQDFNSSCFGKHCTSIFKKIFYEKINYPLFDFQFKENIFIDFIRIFKYTYYYIKRRIDYRKNFREDVSSIVNFIKKQNADYVNVFIPNALGYEAELAFKCLTALQRKIKNIKFIILIRHCDDNFETEMLRIKKIPIPLLRICSDSVSLAQRIEEQINQKVDVLPILSPDHNPIQSHRNHINVTYLGDARREKGFHFLPDLVEHAIHFRENIRFFLQSHLNIPNGETGILAAIERLQQKENVFLKPEAITEHEYNLALDEADILLILYDVQNYMYRTSGIFCEALSRGIPTLIPFGTWMYECIREKNIQYHHDLVQKNICTFSKKEETVSHAFFELTKDTSHFVFFLNTDTEHVNHFSFWIDEPSKWERKLSCVTNQASMCFKNPFFQIKDVAIMFQSNMSVNLDYQGFSMNKDQPLHVISSIFYDTSCIHGAFDDCVSHIEHYKKTAHEHMTDWNHQNLKNMFLQKLIQM